MVANSACGPACVVSAPPCPFSAADFAEQIASEGLKLQAPKLAFEASLVPAVTVTATASESQELLTSAKADTESSSYTLAAASSAAPKSGTSAPAKKISPGAAGVVPPKGKLEVKKPLFPKGFKDLDKGGPK